MSAQQTQQRFLNPFSLVPQVPVWKPGEKSWINGYGDADNLRATMASEGADLQGMKRRYLYNESVDPQVLARKRALAEEAARLAKQEAQRRKDERAKRESARRKKAKIAKSGRIELG